MKKVILLATILSPLLLSSCSCNKKKKTQVESQRDPAQTIRTKTSRF